MRSYKVCFLVDNPLNPDPRVQKEAKTLAGAGYDVTVYCQQAAGLPEYEEKDGYSIRRVFRFKLGSTVYVDKYIKAHRQLWAAVRDKHDLYHCHDVETWPVGYYLAKRDRALLVYDAHEYFPDMIVKENYRSRFKYHASRFLFYLRGSLFIRKAHRLITVSNVIAEEYKEMYGLQTLPLTLYNTRYQKDIPGPSNFIRENYNIRPEETILYFQGNIDPSRGIEKILATVQAVPLTKLFIAGAGSPYYMDKLKKRIEELGIGERVIFAGFLDHYKLLEVAASADVLLYFPVESVKNITLSMPNKFFDYLFAGKPMVVTGLPEIKSFMENNGLGVIIPKESDNTGYIIEQVKRLQRDREWYDGLVRNYDEVRERTCWEQEECKILGMYGELLRNSKAIEPEG